MNIGITGGSTLFTLGERDEVMGFFSRVQEESTGLGGDVSSLIDRLYRRYLRSTELASAARALTDVLGRMAADSSPTEREFQGRFLRGFQQCAESATVNFEAFRDSEGYVYEPVRIVIADRPQFIVEKKRRLEEYDALADGPFWARVN